MTPPENDKPLWTESQVESLLEDFFQKEMPAALRKENPSLPTGVTGSPRSVSTPDKSAQPATPDRANSWTGGAVVVLSSVMMLLVGLMLRDGSPTHSEPNEKSILSPESNTSSQPAEPDPLDALRHNGQGPVESRPRLPHVGVGNPEQPDFPELDIEVFPPDSPAEPHTPVENRNLPESGSAPENEHPMPKENRSLPESQSSGSKDIDEEEDPEPLLPELRSQPQDPRRT